jgi:hypothetical protein
MAKKKKIYQALVTKMCKSPPRNKELPCKLLTVYITFEYYLSNLLYYILL